MRTNDDIPGLIGDLIRKGVIASVDLNAGTAIVTAGDIASPPLPWVEMSGGFSTWCPPSSGEQVILLCQEGDIGHGIILRGLSSNAFPHPATGLRLHLKTPDGSTFDYDPAAHALTITLAGGSAHLEVPQGLSIDGKVIITGDVEVTGKVTATGDVKAGDISLQNHKHGDVQAGAAKTGAPE